MISQWRLQQLVALLAAGKEAQFYSWPEWKELRPYVLEKLDHSECQICKAKGRYRKATIVHHVKHLRERPDLALSIWDGEKRQLLSVCKQCHEDEHPEAFRQNAKAKAPPITEERWD